MTDTWTPARVKRLRQLVADKLSASAIARVLGNGITRNAVIGKLVRLGVKLHGAGDYRPRRPSPRPRKPAQPLKPPAAPQQRVVVFRQPTAAPVAPEPGREHSGPITFAELRGGNTRTQCRWPIGDGPDMRFCGKAIARDPYCAYHARMAWQAPPRKHLEAAE